MTSSYYVKIVGCTIICCWSYLCPGKAGFCFLYYCASLRCAQLIGHIMARWSYSNDICIDTILCQISDPRAFAGKWLLHSYFVKIDNECCKLDSVQMPCGCCMFAFFVCVMIKMQLCHIIRRNQLTGTLNIQITAISLQRRCLRITLGIQCRMHVICYFVMSDVSRICVYWGIIHAAARVTQSWWCVNG